MYRYFNAYEDNNENNRPSQPVEILDEEENDILNSNDNYDVLYSEFDENNELVRRQVKIIQLSHHANDAKHNEKIVNDTIMEIYRMDNFKAIKNIKYITHPRDIDGIQCIIEYTVCVH